MDIILLNHLFLCKVVSIKTGIRLIEIAPFTAIIINLIGVQNSTGKKPLMQKTETKSKYSKVVKKISIPKSSIIFFIDARKDCKYQYPFNKFQNPV